MATRLTRHLTWIEPSELQKAPRLRGFEAGHLLSLTAPAAETAPELPSLDFYTAARERASYLLTVGAEVEHALMAQYLYAGYSLGGPHLSDPKHQELAQKWRETVLQIAREEMGHLATVENVMTLIGAPLSFERQEYPIPVDLYPFPFDLEPLTKKSLGKYVLAEMPDEQTIEKLGLQKEMEEIRKYVGVTDKMAVHRVGLIYDAITKLFTPPDQPRDPPPQPPVFIASVDIQADSRRFQVDPGEWGLGQKDILIETAFDRTSALNAIQAVAVQGEGSALNPEQLDESHFGRFLNIYREFPDENGWRPSSNVAWNPTTDQEALPSTRRITNEQAYYWAGLFNLRYRMLLMFLSHSFRIEAPIKASGRTSRGLLISWAFGEMYNLRSIAEILMRLPIQDGSQVYAGPPFEMPYTLALAARDPDRWRLHRDLLLASQQYVEKLRELDAAGKHETYLKGLYSADQRALDQATMLIGG